MTNLEHALAKALTGLLIDIDLSDDDTIDPDIAMRLLEPVAAQLQGLPAEDQQAIAQIITACAEEETDLDRRTTALNLPHDIGII